MNLFKKNKVSLDIIVLFTRQLSTLINAHISLLDSIHTLASQIEDEYFNTIITDIGKSVEEGNTFADSISKFNDIFSQMYINMIKTDCVITKDGQLTISNLPF